MIQIKSFLKKITPRFLLNWYHFSLAFLANIFYGAPSKKMTVIGVTGTSGKTTTVEFLHAIFSGAGFKTASLSGLNFRILNKTKPNMLKMTMPGRFRIQKFLKEAKNAGAQYVFLEVTSEGIKQYRHKFIKFYAALLTNLSQEHLESHGGFKNYRNAKAKLFKAAPIHILNGDNPNFDFFAKIPAAQKIIYRISDYPKDLKLKLEGEFNKYNALSAVTFARSEGIDDNISKQAIEKIAVMPGRMEFIETGRNFKALVDYAFLPLSLKKVYETAQGKLRSADAKLICVLGAAGGGRDRFKRPILGDIAAEFCAKVFVTNEDPYDEDPMQIINEVAGAHNDFVKILDRREAIQKALNSANKGDIVIITGKGAEPWIVGPNNIKIPWDDRKVVKEILSDLNSDNSDRILNNSDRYKILEHTADFKIKVFGKNLKELLENAMLGMYQGAGYEAEGKKITRKIEISSFDLPSLLVDFLSELLYLTETEQEVYQKIEFQKCAEKNLKAALIGQKLKKIDTQIKGVTYHDLVVKKIDNRWQAVVLFDV